MVKVGDKFLVKQSAWYMMKNQHVVVSRITEEFINYRYLTNDDDASYGQEHLVFIEETIPLTELLEELV